MEEAVQAESLVLPPIVIAELLSGSDDPFRRAAIAEVLQDFPMQFVDLGHWMAVGDLRRNMKGLGVNLTIPDAHVAQCALDLDATLLTRDAVFGLVAEHVPLRLG
jgi:predicted nucleic acid-binding protein